MQADDRFLALSLDGVLEQILRFLPQTERLGTCTRVCRRWAAAAVSVTAQEGLLLQPCNAVSEAWLGKHGAGLQALVVKTGSICGDGNTSSIAGLQQLTRLELNSVTSKPVLLQAAGKNMKELLHLSLINLCWGPLISTSSRDELAAAATVLWEGCTKLTYLQAEQCDLDDACVTSLCHSLPHLRTLDLSHNSLSDPRSLGWLPAALTALFLGGNSEYLDVTTLLQPSNSAGANSSSSSRRGRQQQGPGAAGASHAAQTAADRHADPGPCTGSAARGWLQDLRALDISSLTLRQPQVLADLTTLTWLNVDDTAMPHPSDLLGTLPRLLQLQQLNMMGCFGGRHSTVRVAALSAALGPLTRLTALDIGNNALTNGSVEAAPAGVWDQNEQGAESLRSARQHVFAGLLLPQLHVLGVSDMWDCTLSTPVFAAADLGHLVAACPVLIWLRMRRSLSLESERDLSALTMLSGSLTRLDLSINVHQHLQDGHLQHIAKLQTLSVLDISGVGDQLTDRGLLALTALTSLSFLHLADITSADVSLEVLPTRGRKGVRTAPGDALLLQTKFGKHGCVAASVSQQLKERCAKSPQLWRELQQELKLELKAAKQEAKNARKEAAAERKKTSAAQKQARKAQKQAAAAQDEVAALRQQLEELQSQLQHSQSQSQETGSQ